MKSYICAVIEGIITLDEGFRGFELADIQRVFATLMVEQLLGFFEGGGELWIAVTGEDDLPGTEVEGQHAYLILGDGEAVDHSIGDVLVMHHLEHRGDHHLTGRVVLLAQLVLGHALGQQLAHLRCTHLGQRLLVGLGIVVVLTAYETVTVAHEPYLAAQSAVDDH